MGYSQDPDYLTPKSSTPKPTPWLCFDIETIAREDAAQYLHEPVANRTLKDPEKIAADLEAKRAARLASLSLDMNGCQIIALGYQTDADTEPHVFVVQPPDIVEKHLLELFWRMAKGRRLIGFCSRRFDFPVLYQRSRYLKVDRLRDWRQAIAPYGRSTHVDLWDEWTLDGIQKDVSIPRTLSNGCGLFGMDVPSDPVDGGGIAALWQAGNLEAIRAHCHADIVKTVALARALEFVPEPVAAQELAF